MAPEYSATVERREALHRDFEAVRDELTRELQAEAQQRARTAQLDGLRAASPLVIEPAFAQVFSAPEAASTESLASAVNLDIHQRLTPRRDLTLDGYYQLVYHLLWDDGAGYVCGPESSDLDPAYGSADPAVPFLTVRTVIASCRR